MADSKKLTIEWQAIPMDRVVEFFVKGYERPVESHDWFYDAGKKMLVLRLFAPAKASE